MDKNILNDYIDACENIKDTEKEISKLKKRRTMIVQDKVSGSNPDFPFEKKSFNIKGSSFNYDDDIRLRFREGVLEERRQKAEDLKQLVEKWLNTIPNRMQRIIRYKVFEGMTWEQVATRLGRKATGESVKKEFQRFMDEK